MSSAFIMMFCTVLVFLVGLECCSSNVAFHKPVYSSSVYPISHYHSSHIVAGDRGDIAADGKCCSTDHDDMEPWFMVDLLHTFVFTNITITNRGEALTERLHDLKIELFDVNPFRCPGAVGHFCLLYEGILLGTQTLTCDTKVKGRFLKLTKLSLATRTDTLILCEVEVEAVKDNTCVPMTYPRVSGMDLQQKVRETPVFIPRVECASHCARDTTCVGFNYSPTSGSCQMIVRPTSGAISSKSADINYYGFDLC